MGKALHPKVCGCGSTSFTKEKQGKPWYCESCELGFCTKCGEWPLLTGSDKSCGVCIAQQAYPDCTGCFVYDEITNVSLLQHHGNTCPVHEDKPKSYTDPAYGAVNTHHNPHVDDVAANPKIYGVSQAAECVDCGHIGHQVTTVYNNFVVHHEDADLEDDHDFLLPVGFCPACGQPNHTNNQATCLQCCAAGIVKCVGCGNYHDGSDPCIVCMEIADAEAEATGVDKPKCEVCKATINDELPVAHWKCGKAFQKETCLCGAFDFQQPNDEKAIVCGKCGLKYCAQGCTALIVNTNNEFCDLHMVKDDMPEEVFGTCAQCGDAAGMINGEKFHLDILSKEYTHGVPNVIVVKPSPYTDPFTPCAECGTHIEPGDMTFKDYGKVYKTVHKECVPTQMKPKTLYAKILAEMQAALGENVVSHKIVDDKWGEFVVRHGASEAYIYVDYINGDQHITLMVAAKEGHILVEPPLPGTYDLVGKQPSLVRYNWVFKRYGIPFRVAHKDGFWILRHANTAKLGSARVFQNEKGNPCTLSLVQGS